MDDTHRDNEINKTVFADNKDWAPVEWNGRYDWGWVEKKKYAENDIKWDRVRKHRPRYTKLYERGLEQITKKMDRIKKWNGANKIY